MYCTLVTKTYAVNVCFLSLASGCVVVRVSATEAILKSDGFIIVFFNFVKKFLNYLGAGNVKDTSHSIEIVLFFMEDKNQTVENVLGIFKLVNERVSPADMLRICSLSIKKTMPDALITFLTDTDSTIHQNIEGINVIKTDKIRHEFIMFDLMKFRRDYIKEKVDSGQKVNVVFTDIDIIFNKPINHVFNNHFDVGLPATFYDNLTYSERGVPINSLMSIINCGMFFIKSNERSVQFYDHWLSTMLRLSKEDTLEEYGNSKSMVRKNFLKWWGEPHSIMVMFGPTLLRRENESFTYKGIQIRIFQDADYNFAPDMREENGKLTILLPSDHLESKHVFHLRGGRKLFMGQVAARLNIV